MDLSDGAELLIALGYQAALAPEGGEVDGAKRKALTILERVRDAARAEERERACRTMCLLCGSGDVPVFVKGMLWQHSDGQPCKAWIIRHECALPGRGQPAPDPGEPISGHEIRVEALRKSDAENRRLRESLDRVTTPHRKQEHGIQCTECGEEFPCSTLLRAALSPESPSEKEK